MKKALKYILLFALSLLSVSISTAQGLPEAPRDSSVCHGTLPNGMSYYLVSNPTTEKVADFALVQKTGFRHLGEKASTIARNGLTSLTRLQVSPQAFLASYGVSPSRDGFVKVTENATLYHFDNVIMADEAVDSVLLVLMDIADRGTFEADSLWHWYTPEDQAVIVSGGIDTTVFYEKLKMLSYMTPKQESKERKLPEWQSTEEPVYQVESGSSEHVAKVSLTWTSPRLPKKYINTVQPAVYSMFINELGLLAKDRSSQRFRQQGIPVADVSYEHISSLMTFDQEKFIVSASVAPEHTSKAVEILSSVMSSIDSGAVSVDDFVMAKRRYFAILEKQSRQALKSNSEYVMYCASSFLYDAPLSSSKEIYPFLKNRDISLETELAHFNKISAALLDGKQNISVTCVSANDAPITKQQLQQAFESAWEADESVYEGSRYRDTLPLPHAGLPVKLKKSRKEPMSDGVVWTFENGFRVVYKKLDTTSRQMHYALALNGGYGNIRRLSPGEGAYVSDYMNLSKVCGVPSEEFCLVLEQKDIVLKTSVSLSNTVIEGSAPDSELDLMMRALLAFVNERECDKDAFEYYKACLEVELNQMKGSVRDRIVAIDSLMCPEYEYSSLKTQGKITDDFSEKVERFWAVQSGKTNDGVLVLVGNVDETSLKKLLQGYIGEFRTTDRIYPRLNVTYQPVSGSIAYTFKGDRNSVDVALSARLPLTAENYMASDIAASVLKQQISRSIDGTGMYLRLVHDCRIYPQERFNMLITLEEADPQGFAHDVQLSGSSSSLAILRKVLADLPDLELTDEDLLKHKEVLKGQIALSLSDSEYWLHALAKRYLDGKDFTTSYESRIDAITADKVKSILASLSDTSRVEYIIEK